MFPNKIYIFDGVLNVFGRNINIQDGCHLDIQDGQHSYDSTRLQTNEKTFNYS